MIDDNKRDTTVFEVASDKLPFFQAFVFAFQDDTRLSLAAKGLLAILLSFGKGWRIYMKDVVKRSSSGRYVLRKAVKELQDSGYLSKKALKDSRGRFSGWSYIVYQKPQLIEKPEYNGKTNLPNFRKMDTPCNGHTVPPNFGKTASVKYTQVINNNNFNNPQQQYSNVVVDKLKDLKITEEVIQEISFITDEVTLLLLINYAEQKKLGAGWVIKAARDPQKRPAFGELEAQAVVAEIAATKDCTYENYNENLTLAEEFRKKLNNVYHNKNQQQRHPTKSIATADKINTPKGRYL